MVVCVGSDSVTALTCFNGGVQLTKASSDLSIHLALPGWLLRKWVSVCPKRLTDLHMAHKHGQPRPYIASQHPSSTVHFN